MTRSCYHPTRGYCFCEFCIASHLKNAYVQANNSPKEPIDFKNFKKSVQMSPLEIYCKQFANVSSAEQIINLQKRASTKTPLNSPNQKTNDNKVNISVDDNQTKFLRILSDRLTQLADQQAQYLMSTNNHGQNTNLGQNKNLINKLNESISNSSILKRRANFVNMIKLDVRQARLRSSISESSGYETGETRNESPLPTTAHNSAGMLFISTNQTGQKQRIKFGPEDILATTNPMLLFSSNLVDNSSLLKRSKRRRKSINKKDSSTVQIDKLSSNQVVSTNSQDVNTKIDLISNTKERMEDENSNDDNIKKSNVNKISNTALSNVTNTLKNAIE